MEFSKFKEVTLGNNKLLKYSVIGNVLLGITLMIVSIGAVSNKERVVLVPPHLDERMEISYNDANESYYTSFAFYFSVLIGNANPSNTRYIVDNLKYSLAPGLYSQIRSTLLEDAKKLEMQGASVTFVPSQTPVYDPEKNETCIVGRETKVSALGSKEFNTVVYRMGIEIIRGVPKISSLDKEIVKNAKSCR